MSLLDSSLGLVKLMGVVAGYSCRAVAIVNNG